MEVRIADYSPDGLLPEPELMRSPTTKHRLFHKFLNKFSSKDEATNTDVSRDASQVGQENIRRLGPRGVGVGPPRQQTFRRQNSERREKLEPVQTNPEERRTKSVSRQRALSVQRPRARSSPPPPFALPRHSLPVIKRSDDDPFILSDQPNEDGDVERTSSQVSETFDNDQFDDAENKLMDMIDRSILPPPIPYDDLIQQELDSKWILNLSMHFRDKSNREKFFVTYAETPTKWRRVTISCDYRHAEPGSLEMDLKELQYQRDKSLQIYESIRDSLLEIQFYDTVTNLKLETSQGRLHVHVTEDVNEIIPYPPIESVQHMLDDSWDSSTGLSSLRTVTESELEFHSHLSGFVYRVIVSGQDYIKKEIPGPDSVDEFLYEINALHALTGSKNVIQLRAIVLDDARSLVKGLLIDFAAQGAMVDLLFDNRAQGGIPWDERARWAEQIVSGLNEVHEAGFVQGDFTLSNVVVDGNGDAWIIDINRRGCPVGWEPPEIEQKIKSNQRISMYIGVKSDLFQLGMTLWALAMQDDEPERRDRPLSAENFPVEIPEWYRRIVRSCLSAKPQERRTAKDLLGLFPETSHRQLVESSTAVDSEDIERLRNYQSFTPPSPPIARTEDHVFGDDALVPPPSSSYQFDSGSSYVGISRRARVLDNDVNMEESRRGRRRSREDELELEDDSDFEPQVVSISPGVEQPFEEVELDGNPYLVSRNSFSPEELEILGHHGLDQERRGSIEQSLEKLDPTESVETVSPDKGVSGDNSEKPQVAPLSSNESETTPRHAPMSMSSTTTTVPPLDTTLNGDLAGLGGHPTLEHHSPDEPSFQPVPYSPNSPKQSNDQERQNLLSETDQTGATQLIQGS